MNIDNQGDAHHPEKLDADAVCIQCGTVNEEGTLLCKMCGNNLRDQRNRRMAADQVLEQERAGSRRRAWLSGIAFVLGVGLIISTLLNQDMIVNWLMDMNAPAEHQSTDMWQGPYSGRIDALLTELQDNLPTEDMALEARANPEGTDTLDGVYVLFDEDDFVGSANVRTDGDEVLFVALLGTDTELRGLATLQGDYYIMVPESGGMKSHRRVLPVEGVASLQEGGVIECVGDDMRTRYSCLAYKLAF